MGSAIILNPTLMFQTKNRRIVPKPYSDELRLLRRLNPNASLESRSFILAPLLVGPIPYDSQADAGRIRAYSPANTYRRALRSALNVLLVAACVLRY